MKKRFFALMIIMLAVMMLGVLSSAEAAMSDRWSGDTIKIGYLANLTGSGAYTDIPPKLAIEDYIKEVNAKGGWLGKKLELISYDAGRDALTESVTAVNKMIQQDKVIAIVGPTGSRYAIPIVQLCNESKTPCITIGATNAKVTVNEDTGAVHPYMFRVSFADSYQGSAMANFAFKELGIKEVATIAGVDDLYAQGILKYFTDEFKRLGGKIINTQSYQTSDVEFRAQLSAIDNSGAKVLYSPACEYKYATLISKQAEQLGLEFTYLFPDGVYAPELMETAGPQVEGAYLSTPMTDDAPEYADYKKAFDARHKKTGYKANIYAYYGMDGIMLLEWAVKKTKSFDGEVLKKALESAKNVPLFTESFTIDPKTHNPLNKSVTILQIKDSKYHHLKTFKPTK
ncbi:ABC transporter substrate-binding protein [Cloacibacillus sp.]|uniref:ABC transporter substrate-binding protein n=1 Tax=Cloacibacillus sp. TaxID=2049023 RepID=UPI0025BA3A12|nr:ABC transporter substrate-binding protein [Cloacibacillus sp.]MCC8056270.1 ABC transporter substrate-binding protein [Cloacibacillus sp.]